MSQRQRDALDELLRHGPLDVGGDVAQQRLIFSAMASAQPLPGDVVVTEDTLGGVPVLDVEIADVDHSNVVVYVHGGGYALGSAAASVGLASDLIRHTSARAVTVDYRLAPEHPYPAAIEDVRQVYDALLGDVGRRRRSRSPASLPVRGWRWRCWSQSGTAVCLCRALRC